MVYLITGMVLVVIIGLWLYAIARKKELSNQCLEKGNCIDNCITESFFGTLKNEMFYGHESEFKTFRELHRVIDKYISIITTTKGLRVKQNRCQLLNLGRHPCQAYDIIQLTCPVYLVHIK